MFVRLFGQKLTETNIFRCSQQGQEGIPQVGRHMFVVFELRCYYGNPEGCRMIKSESLPRYCFLTDLRLDRGKYLSEKVLTVLEKPRQTFPNSGEPQIQRQHF